MTKKGKTPLVAVFVHPIVFTTKPTPIPPFWHPSPSPSIPLSTPPSPLAGIGLQNVVLVFVVIFMSESVFSLKLIEALLALTKVH